MTFVGLAVTFLGFVIAFASLGITDSTGGRMSSARMPVTRSSVDRSARDTSEVTTIVMMNSEAILMPSGRSKTLVIVV